jgi:hypothetical protein
MSDTPPAEAARGRGWMDEVWSFVGSIPFAVTVLVLIAVASVIGTLVPQMPMKTHAEAMELLGKLEPDWGVAKARLFIYAHLYDVWHAWWYQFLLVLLLASACVCTIDRLGSTLRRFRRPRVAVEPRVYASLRGSRSLRSADPLAGTAEKLRRHFRGHGYQVLEAEGEGSLSLLARKGRLSLLGPLTVHVSLVVILVAAVWCTSPLFGNARGSVSLVEGGFELDELSGLYIECEDFEIRYSEEKLPEGERHGGPATYYKASGYTSRLAFYEATDGPADRSVRVIREQQQPPLIIPADDPSVQGMPDSANVATVKLKLRRRATVEVNQPTREAGVEFFQQSRNLVGFEIAAIDPSGHETTRQVALVPRQEEHGIAVYVPRAVRFPVVSGAADAPRTSLVVTGFAQRYENGVPLSDDPGTAPKPALEITRISEADDKVSDATPLGWIPEGGSLTRDGWTLTFRRPIYSTTLETRRFPGLWLLLAGFCVTGLGLVLSFWIPLREVRVRLTDREGACEVAIGVPRSYPYDDAGALVSAAARVVEDTTAPARKGKQSGKERKPRDQ